MTENSYFAARLAYRQLIFDRPKLIAATLGVLFACVLVFMQMGFRDSLNTSAASAPIRMNADLFLLHKQSEAMWRTVQFPRTTLMRAMGHPDVAAVYPMYMSLAPFKNMDTHTTRTLMVYGYSPEIDMMRIDGIKKYENNLKSKDNIIFDELSRPEFGPVANQIAQGRNITEINDYKVQIAGTVKMGTSFAADGNVITNEQNFHRIFQNRHLGKIDLGFIKLKDKNKTKEVQTALRNLMGHEILVLTYDELVKLEQDYWQNSAPIGFIFGMGIIMGLIVGMVIVYQILFTDITNNLSQYATLKAMGYSHNYLVRVVFSSAALLAVLGFIPGLFVSLLLYQVAEANIYIPFPMPFSKIVTVFFFILTMCFGAGLFAIRKLRAADPADMF